jgi:hypothetical protein
LQSTAAAAMMSRRQDYLLEFEPKVVHYEVVGKG